MQGLSGSEVAAWVKRPRIWGLHRTQSLIVRSCQPASEGGHCCSCWGAMPCPRPHGVKAPSAAGQMWSGMRTNVSPATGLASRRRPKRHWERCAHGCCCPSALLPSAIPYVTCTHPASNPWTRAASTALDTIRVSTLALQLWNRARFVAFTLILLGLLTETWVRKRFLGSSNPVPHVHNNKLAQLAQHPHPAPSSWQFGLLPSLLALNSCSQGCHTNGCHCCLICSQIHSHPI